MAGWACHGIERRRLGADPQQVRLGGAAFERVRGRVVPLSRFHDGVRFGPGCRATANRLHDYSAPRWLPRGDGYRGHAAQMVPRLPRPAPAAAAMSMLVAVLPAISSLLCDEVHRGMNVLGGL